MAEKYTFAGLQAMIGLLQEWLDAADVLLAHAQNNYGGPKDDERIEALVDRAQFLEGAIDNLEAIKR